MRATTTENALDVAEASFRRASALVPDNLAVTMRLGALLERRDQYVEALAHYHRFVDRWGRVFEPRYRMAATLGMSDSWLGLVPGAPSDQQARLAKVLGRKSVGDLETVDLHATMLETAKTQWEELERFVSLRLSMWRFLGSVVRRTREYNDAAYQRQFLTRRFRRQVVRTISLGRLTTEIQQHATWPQPMEPGVPPTVDLKVQLNEVDELLGRSRGRPAERTYNGACAYARAYELSGDEEHAERAVKLLQEVLSSGSATRWVTSIKADPDILALRRTPVFRSWWAELGRGEEAWGATKWAGALADALAKRWGTQHELLQSFPGTTAFPKKAEYRDQNLMTSLAQWAGADDEAMRKSAGETLIMIAAELHVRFPAPPSKGEQPWKAWSAPGKGWKGADLPSVVATLTNIANRPVSGAMDRRLRWEDVTELFANGSPALSDPPWAFITHRTERIIRLTERLRREVRSLASTWFQRLCDPP